MPDYIIDAKVILNNIRDGHQDDRLDDILLACQERRDYKSTALRYEIAPGDVIQFTDSISPKYLRGKTATVLKVNQKTATLQCPSDFTYQRFCGTKMRCPLTLIEAVES
jgi:hypothetical protein